MLFRSPTPRRASRRCLPLRLTGRCRRCRLRTEGRFTRPISTSSRSRSSSSHLPRAREGRLLLLRCGPSTRPGPSSSLMGRLGCRGSRACVARLASWRFLRRLLSREEELEARSGTLRWPRRGSRQETSTSSGGTRNGSAQTGARTAGTWTTGQTCAGRGQEEEEEGLGRSRMSSRWPCAGAQSYRSVSTRLHSMFLSHSD